MGHIESMDADNTRRRRLRSFAAAVVTLAFVGCEFDPFVSLCRPPGNAASDEIATKPPLAPLQSEDPISPAPAKEENTVVVDESIVPTSRREPTIITVAPSMILGTPPTAKLQPIDADEPAPKIAVEQIELMPLPEQAGVGQTIVAIARLLDADGKPVSNADLEWALDRAGAGTIIAVGGSPATSATDVRLPDYAAARSSSTTYRLDGIAGMDHSVTIEPGASWCVLRSHHAGPMTLYVRSRDVESPDRGQAIHRLRWIEATLETSPTVDALNPYAATLVARVQTLSGEPLSGYPVLFAVEDASGRFATGSTHQAVSDNAGKVTVDLQHASDTPATTSVTATLFDATAAPGKPIELQRSTIEVRWPNPTIDIVVKAPAIARIRSNVSIAAEVRIDSPPAQWNANIAAVVGMGLEAPRLAPDSTDDAGVRFVLARLEADESTAAELIVSSQLPGERTVRFEVRDGTRVLALREAVIRFIEPLAALEKTFPKNWKVGQTASYRIVVRNPGPVALEGLVVEDEIPPGLRIDGTDGVRFTDRLRWDIAQLSPAEEKQFEVQATPVAPFANLAVRAWAKEPLSPLAESYDLLNVDGIEAIELAIDDLSDPVKVGEQAEYEVRLLNRGTSLAKGIELDCEISSELQLLSAKGSLPCQIVDGQVRLGPVASIEPGQELTCRVRLKAINTGDARIALRASHPSLGAEGIQRSESTRIYK